MTVARAVTGDVFKTRLNELFAAADPKLTNAAVVQGLLELGCRISKPYLSQLRHGRRSSPSDEVVAACAEYFGVSSEFFFTVSAPDSRCGVHAEDIGIVERLEDPTHRALLLATIGLSAASLELLAELTTKLRHSDGRPVVPADSPSYVRLVEAELRPRRRIC